MNSHQKTPKESAASSSVSRSSGLFQKIWQSCFAVFKKQFAATAETEPRIRKRFCSAAIAALTTYKQTSTGLHKGDHDLPVEDHLIAALQDCATYEAFMRIIDELPTRASIKKLLADDIVDEDLGYLLVSMKEKLAVTPYHTLNKKFSPSAMDFDGLSQLAQKSETSSGEFIAYVLCKFINFYPDATTFAPCNHDTKLRLSVDPEMFPAAWDIMRDFLLSQDSPFDCFKILHVKHINALIEQFVDYQKTQVKYTKQGQGMTPEAHQKILADMQGFLNGGQVVLYLPSTIEDEKVQIAVVTFLQNMVETLRTNGIDPGKIPASDRKLTDYISGRVGKEDGKYLVADAAKNAADPMLTILEKLFNPSVSAKPTLS